MKKNKKKVVFVGLSGGVDSSVSAILLLEKGYEVVGVFIRTWHPDFLVCNEEEERRDAMRVAAHLKIPFLTFDFEDIYKNEVAMYMINEYKEGRTPNPDVMCNKEVKFGAFLEKALSMGADFVATGHYARSIKFPLKKNLITLPASGLRRAQDFSSGGELLKGLDPSKDQSYFLWTLNQERLSKILFPVGHLKKTEVRKIAKKYNLPVASKKDSQGICFLGDIDLKTFLKHYIKEKRGKVLNKEGIEIGFHEGVFFNTLGSRHGFTITQKGINDKPYYVINKDIENNLLIVDNKASSLEDAGNNLIEIKNTNWIKDLPKTEYFYTAQIRYHGQFLKCRLSSVTKDTASIFFEKKILVAKGQSIVFYEKDTVLGGGVVV